MAKYETIGVDPRTKATIDRLAKKYDLSIVKLMSAMAEYFDLVGINPTDRQVLSPAEELKKFRDTIISFMRKQEKDYILPVFGQMEVLIARFMQYLENEAPKKGGENMFSTPLLEEIKEVPKRELDVPDTKISVAKTDTSNLEMDIEIERQKIRNIKNELAKIFSNYEFKSTGLQKKIVIDMPQIEFEKIREMVKLL